MLVLYNNMSHIVKNTDESFLDRIKEVPSLLKRGAS
jgi:hypothetical protein